MVTVKMPKPLDRKYKSWAKRLDDIDDSQPGGFAFVGDFLRLSKKSTVEVDLMEGQLVLTYMGLEPTQPGSENAPVVSILRVEKDGSLFSLYSCECDSNKGWSREVFKEIKTLFIREKSFQPRKAVRALVEHVSKTREIMDNFDLSNLEDIPFRDRDDIKTILAELSALAEELKSRWEQENNESKSSGVTADPTPYGSASPIEEDPGNIPF
jgi:hypothetical protein